MRGGMGEFYFNLRTPAPRDEGTKKPSEGEDKKKE